MPNWLQKFTSPATGVLKGLKLPVKWQPGQLPAQPLIRPQERLPNASLIYGLASGALFAIAIYYLVTGRWFTGAMVMLPAGCLFGFALHFLRR